MNISRYTLLDISEVGFLALMQEDGSVREDLKLPKENNDLCK